MRSLTKQIVCLLFCSAIFTTIESYASEGLAQDQSNQEKIIGIWLGKLQVSGIELRIVFKISETEDGSLTAKMDSPDQGASDISASRVIFEEDSLWIEVNSIRGVYEGKFIEDSTSIDGHWKQSGFILPLVLKRSEEVPKLNRPQEPKKPYPYIEQEVSYPNEKAGIQLAGTLTLPDTIGQHSAVILITGSGAQDRNETVFGHRPFLVLADYLTRHGIAVLRVDDRGVGGSTGNTAQSTSEDFASDVLAGMKYLKTRKEIDPKKIGLIGHSEGGIIAPMVAAQSPDVAFVVLMAGTGLTGKEILKMQMSLILKANGIEDSVIQKNLSFQEQMFAALKQVKDDSMAANKLRTILETALTEMTDEEKEALGISEATIDAQVKQLTSPWFRYFLIYDPKSALMKVKCPVLAINGELDLQVPPKENLTALEEALKAGGNKNYTVKEFPNLNHLFQTAKTGSPTEYAKIEETISQGVLKFIGDWIIQQTNW